MKSLYHFLTGHAFILASGLAALIHSTWSLDVAFAGAEVNLSQDPLNALFRKFVAFLIAVAIDVGQIATAAEIKAGHKSKSKYLTFFSFAMATYLLQFYYMAQHTLTISLSSGIRADWLPVVKLVTDAMIWVVPALLPASTLLYTFSQQTNKYESEMRTELEARMRVQEEMYDKMNEEIERRMADRLEIERRATTALQPPSATPTPYKLIAGENLIWAECPECEWKRSYPNDVSAKNGLTSHKPYCKKTKVEVNIE